jgi:hypothetical protein
MTAAKVSGICDTNSEPLEFVWKALKSITRIEDIERILSTILVMTGLIRVLLISYG